jgi:hypothetical protein
MTSVPQAYNKEELSPLLVACVSLSPLRPPPWGGSMGGDADEQAYKQNSFETAEA